MTLKAHPLVCKPGKKPLPAEVLGQRVRVHPNFQNGCYSVASLKDDRVLGYTDGLLLAHVTVRFHKSGYERCHAEQERNVHAWLEGELTEIGARLEGAPPGWRRLRYNCLTQTSACILYEGTDICFASAPEVLGLPQGRMWVPPASVASTSSAAIGALQALRALVPGLHSPAVLDRLARGG